MRVVVTGANGYLGAWVVHELELRGAEVRGLSSHRQVVHGAQLPYCEADALVHLGWYAAPAAEHVHRSCYEESVALRQLYRCRSVFASSMSVYGDRGSSLVTHGTPPEPNCPYSRAKLEAEALFDVSLRLGTLMGRGLTRTRVDTCVNAFATGAEELWDADAWKPYVHVRDAAEQIAGAAVDPPLDGAYILAAGSLRASEIARIACGKVRSAERPLHRARKSCRTRHVERMRTLESAVEELRGYVPRREDRTDPQLYGCIRMPDTSSAPST